MHWKIQSRTTKSLVTVGIVVMVMLIPNARPDDGPRRGESRSVDHRQSETSESSDQLQDSQNNADALVAIEKRTRKRRNLFRACSAVWTTRSEISPEENLFPASRRFLR